MMIQTFLFEHINEMSNMSTENARDSECINLSIGDALAATYALAPNNHGHEKANATPDCISLSVARNCASKDTDTRQTEEHVTSDDSFSQQEEEPTGGRNEDEHI